MDFRFSCCLALFLSFVQTEGAELVGFFGNYSTLRATPHEPSQGWQLEQLPSSCILIGYTTSSPQDDLSGRQRPYPLIPVSVMPSMKVRWAKKKRTRMGRVTTMAAAIMRS